MNFRNGNPFETIQMKRDEIEEYISDPNRLYRILTGNGVFLPP